MKRDLLKIPGVVAVGRDRDGRYIVYVKSGFKPESLPIDKRKIKIREMGEVEPFFSTLSRVRPVVSGVSVSHYMGTAGSFGAVVKKNGDYYGLSANHVVALRWGNIAIGRKGDDVIQPGRSDGGEKPKDTIGFLSDWIDVRSDKINYIDAGIFSLVKPASEIVPDIGRLDGLGKVMPGDIVRKFGRSSLLTQSVVDSVDVIAVVKQWGEVVFDKQIMVKQPFAVRGDSGSVVVDEMNRVVGIVIAGSGKYVLVTPADLIERSLGIKFVGVRKWS